MIYWGPSNVILPCVHPFTYYYFGKSIYNLFSVKRTRSIVERQIWKWINSHRYFERSTAIISIIFYALYRFNKSKRTVYCSALKMWKLPWPPNTRENHACQLKNQYFHHISFVTRIERNNKIIFCPLASFTLICVFR